MRATAFVCIGVLAVLQAARKKTAVMSNRTTLGVVPVATPSLPLRARIADFSFIAID